MLLSRIFTTVHLLLVLSRAVNSLFWVPRAGKHFTSHQSLPGTTEDSVQNEYDFIVIGGGTAGLVVASRLAEIRQWQILVLEAGGGRRHESDEGWKLKAELQPETCLAAPDQRCTIPGGRGLGGSTRTNSMLYVRGTQQDYDGWARKGNTDWAFRSVLPYFLKLENTRFNYSREQRGRGGPLPVTGLRLKSTLARTFLAACDRYGLRRADYNSDANDTVGYVQLTRRQGKRVTSTDAYLKPVRALLPNLHTLTGARVTKVLLNSRTKAARGVRVLVNGQLRKIRARREVILAAGPIFTPHLLLLSGIGPRQQLERFNISVVADLPVGATMNLRTVSFPLHFVTNGTTAPARLTSPTLEAIAFVNTLPGRSGQPTHEILFQYEPQPGRGEQFSIGLVHLQPSSAGLVRLRSENPLHDPLVYTNFYTHPGDMGEILRGIGACLAILNDAELRRFDLEPLALKLAPCEKLAYATDAYWRCVVRFVGHVADQPTGTCPMGRREDARAVVSPELQVHGVHNLRIVDASVMLPVSNAHTQATVYMIAEKASDLIKSYWDWGNDWERRR